MEIYGSAVFSSGNFDAVKNIKEVIAPHLMGMNVLEQKEIDEKLIELDATEDKSRLGSGIMFAISVAAVRAASHNLDISVRQYLGGISGKTTPCPIMHFLSGNKIDDFMITPAGFLSPLERVKACLKVTKKLQDLLKEEKIAISFSQNGAFYTNLESNDLALGLIKKAISESEFEVSQFEITTSLPKNSLLIIPNEIGTVTESIHSIKTAKETGNLPIVSLSSSETEDSFVVDLCVAINVKLLKIGVPMGGERTAKYNALLSID